MKLWTHSIITMLWNMWLMQSKNKHSILKCNWASIFYEIIPIQGALNLTCCYHSLNKILFSDMRPLCHYCLEVWTNSPVSVINKLGDVADWTCGIAKSTLPCFLTLHSYSLLPRRLHFLPAFPFRFPKIIMPVSPETI